MDSNRQLDTPLNGDPCDGCGGTAAVKVALGNGGTLLFCAACWRKHENAIRGTAVAVRG